MILKPSARLRSEAVGHCFDQALDAVVDMTQSVGEVLRELRDSCNLQ